MISSLRRRLILSHVLPLLVIIPLIGIALIYVLETRVLLPNLADELTSEAKLVADIASDQPDIGQDLAKAQIFVQRIGASLDARVMLLGANGSLLASTDPADAQRAGQRLPGVNLTNVLAGQTSTSTSYSQNLHTDVVDVWVPIIGPNSQVTGIVRVTHQFATVRQWLVRLRYLIAAVLAVGLAIGVAMGGLLAVELERPLRRVTRAVYQLASEQRLTPLPEYGPEEVRMLTRAVNSLAERRHQSEKMSRELLSNLVHELGRPMGACQSAIYALQQGAVNDELMRDELLGGMAVEVRSLRRLLDDLARLYDRTAGQLELHRHPVELGEWLPKVLSPWREAARAKELAWESDGISDLPTVEIDSDRLGQALGNLLSNAIKYTPAGGKVSVSAGTADRGIWMRVSDTGPGITAEDQAHIFAPFYRVQKADDEHQGMGLGLGIARDLVVAHDGHLEVESSPGAGSHFTLWLPLSAVRAGVGGEEAQRQAGDKEVEWVPRKASGASARSV